MSGSRGDCYTWTVTRLIVAGVTGLAPMEVQILGL
jgi:hypothetical protein